MKYPKRADRADYTDFTFAKPKRKKIGKSPIKKNNQMQFRKVVMCISGLVVSISAVSFYLYWRN